MHLWFCSYSFSKKRKALKRKHRTIFGGLSILIFPRDKVPLSDQVIGKGKFELVPDGLRIPGNLHG